jgi:hypothetical protein
MAAGNCVAGAAQNAAAAKQSATLPSNHTLLSFNNDQ